MIQIIAVLAAHLVFRAVVLDVDGVEVRVTSPSKEFFPTRGESKLDLKIGLEALWIVWWLRIADWLGRL